MLKKKIFRGYIFSRRIEGNLIPQRVQNLVIKDYCERHKLFFKLSATEYKMENCYLMLKSVLKNLNSIDGIVFYSIFMLPNLKKERLNVNKKIFKVGNTISDIIKKYSLSIDNNSILKKLNLKKKNYYLMTLHRPETVDDPKEFRKLILIFEHLGKKFNRTFVFPTHPRTKKIINKFNLTKINCIKFIDPLEFLDFLSLMKNSDIVFTDSGGIQEETSLLGVPCITVRTTTERQITTKEKTNIVTGYNYNKIQKAIKYFNKKKLKPSNIFGNGRVAEKILEKLKKLKN